MVGWLDRARLNDPGCEFCNDKSLERCSWRADPRLLLVVVEGKNLSQVNFNGSGFDRSNNKKKKVKKQRDLLLKNCPESCNLFSLALRRALKLRGQEPFQRVNGLQ